jgi:hypothetical protein
VSFSLKYLFALVALAAIFTAALIYRTAFWTLLAVNIAFWLCSPPLLESGCRGSIEPSGCHFVLSAGFFSLLQALLTLKTNCQVVS